MNSKYKYNSKLEEELIIEDRKMNLSLLRAVFYCILWMVTPLLIAVALMVVFATFSAFIPSIDMYDVLSNSYVEMFLSFSSVYLTIVIITKNDFKKLQLNFKGRINRYWVLGTVLFSTGLHIIVSEIDNIVQYFMPLSGEWLETFQELSELPIGIYFLLVVVTAPIVEELFLRGVIAKGLSNRYSKNKAIVFTAILFGLVHLNIWQFVAAFIGGLYLSWLYLNSNALLLSILAHAIHNGLSLVADYLGLEIVGYNVVYSEGIVHQPLWFNFIGLVLMGIAILMFKKAKDFSNINNVDDINNTLNIGR